MRDEPAAKDVAQAFQVSPGARMRLDERDPADKAGLPHKAAAKERTEEDAAAIAKRWHDAREEYRAALAEREGDVNFAGLQRFLTCVHRLSTDRRLSRYCYLAERAA